jgi:hypothetical protein
MSDECEELAPVLNEVYQAALVQGEDVFLALAKYALGLAHEHGQEIRERCAQLGDELSGITMSGAGWAKLVREG